MPLELLSYYLNAPVFLMALSRLGGMIMFQPVLGALSVPIAVRAMFVLALTILVMPFVHVGAHTPDTLAGLTIAMVQELLLGAIMGVSAALVFLGVQMGGTLIAQEAGLGFSEVVNPDEGGQSTVISVFFVQLGTVIFLIAGGHRALLGACLESFRQIPLLCGVYQLEAAANLFLDTLVVSFELAARVAAPAIITLFLMNLAMGFVSRTVPQLNIMILGFAVKGLVGFVVMAISLPLLAWALLEAFEGLLGELNALVGG